jgi:hypothetical protein
LKKDLGFHADIIFEKPSPISIKMPNMMEGGRSIIKRIDINKFFKPGDQGDQTDHNKENTKITGEKEIKISEDEIKMKALEQLETISLKDILKEYEE